jgi:hypothetical protein
MAFGSRVISAFSIPGARIDFKRTGPEKKL